MIVAVAATQMELDPFLAAAGEPADDWQPLVGGVGLLETAVRLGRFLSANEGKVSAVLQFGIGGAYVDPAGSSSLPLLSVCLAEREVLGDLGVVLADRFEYFPDELGGAARFSLSSPLLEQAKQILAQKDIACHSGTFITVNSVSGTALRGEQLRKPWNGLCENMEGAAAARLCLEYNLPLVQLRVISNLVEDRDRRNWRIGEASRKAGELAAMLIKEL